jgi:hypothetical protein|tara:strand:- start:320 stop:538 length:219 start_codon:yes stop_codon:yes gene_type:complete
MLTCLKDKHAFKHIEEMKAKLSDKPLPALLKAMLQVDPPAMHMPYTMHMHMHMPCCRWTRRSASPSPYPLNP